MVDVQEESDTTRGASLHDAEIRRRRPVRDHRPCHHRPAEGRTSTPTSIIYVVDKRQELHFVRVFRCAYKTGLIDKNKCSLEFVGFGTMNGKDGKPFKTRDGGVMRLEYLLGRRQRRHL